MLEAENHTLNGLENNVIGFSTGKVSGNSFLFFYTIVWVFFAEEKM